MEAPPANWYPDPHGPGRRWWDGERWTDHVQQHERGPVRQGVGIGMGVAIGLVLVFIVLPFLIFFVGGCGAGIAGA